MVVPFAVTICSDMFDEFFNLKIMELTLSANKVFVYMVLHIAISLLNESLNFERIFAFILVCELYL